MEVQDYTEDLDAPVAGCSEESFGSERLFRILGNDPAGMPERDLFAIGGGRGGVSEGL